MKRNKTAGWRIYGSNDATGNRRVNYQGNKGNGLDWIKKIINPRKFEDGFAFVENST